VMIVIEKNITVAGASVVVPGPDEAKVDPDPIAVNPAVIYPVAS